MNSLISIIVPVYNVENYLTACVDSILTQSYGNFEIILVDDGSTDQSGVICDEYARKDSRILAIHKNNEGPSAARNQALKAASGDYIYFMDSDDEIEPDLLEQVMQALQKNNAEVTIFGYTEEHYNDHSMLMNTKDIQYQQVQFIDTQLVLRERVISLEQMNLFGYIWNKVFSAGYLRKNRILFDETLSLMEDAFFVVQVFEHIEKLNILNRALYHYKRRSRNGLVYRLQNKSSVLHCKRIQAIYEQHVRWGLCTASLKTYLGAIYMRHLFDSIQSTCHSQAEMSRAQRREWLKSVYRQDMFSDLAPYAKSGNFIFSVVIYALRRKNAWLPFVLGDTICFIRNKLPRVVASLRPKEF